MRGSGEARSATFAFAVRGRRTSQNSTVRRCGAETADADAGTGSRPVGHKTIILSGTGELKWRSRNLDWVNIRGSPCFGGRKGKSTGQSCIIRF